jgi:hypothetical protein
MARKASLSPLEQRDAFRRAFDTYRHYLDGQNYIGAYVVAFSILEDRINALFITRYRIQHGDYPTELRVQRTPFARKLAYLLSQGDIAQDDHDTWSACAADRNSKVHAAMWNLDAFQRADAESILRAAQRASMARATQKRKHKLGA